MYKRKLNGRQQQLLYTQGWLQQEIERNNKLDKNFDILGKLQNLVTLELGNAGNKEVSKTRRINVQR
jgi:hypothetical protein